MNRPEAYGKVLAVWGLPMPTSRHEHRRKSYRKQNLHQNGSKKWEKKNTKKCKKQNGHQKHKKNRHLKKKAFTLYGGIQMRRCR